MSFLDNYGDPPEGWARVGGLSGKFRMVGTNLWVTAYNERGLWWAMFKHELLGRTDTRAEAIAICEATFLLQEAP